MQLQKRKEREVISGEHRDKDAGLSLPNQRSENVSSRKSCTKESILHLLLHLLHFDEKLSMVEILLTGVQWTIAIRHVKEHLGKTEIPLRHSPKEHILKFSEVSELIKNYNTT